MKEMPGVQHASLNHFQTALDKFNSAIHGKLPRVGGGTWTVTSPGSFSRTFLDFVEEDYTKWFTRWKREHSYANGGLAGIGYAEGGEVSTYTVKSGDVVGGLVTALKSRLSE
jgi:hypothetical protein